MKFFRKIQTANKDVMLLQNAVEQSLGPLSRLALVNGTLLQNIDITSAAPTKIAHQLGRQPTGWFVVDIQGAVTVFRTAWTDTTISLQASSDVVCSIWIY